MDYKIEMLMRQTNYSREECIEKLKNAEITEIIKEYMGISEKKINRNKKSIQQEIYSQIRNQMDTSIKEFNKKQNEKLEKEIENLNKEI